MKILLISTSDLKGGASKAVYRLHLSLLAHGVDSQMIVQNKMSDDYTVLGPITKREQFFSMIRPHIETIPVRFYRNRIKTSFSSSLLPSKIHKLINDINPDIVHLGWINEGTIRIEDLVKIKAPIVWQLHDMWPFTGGCHYSNNCTLYKNNCGNCIILGSTKTKDLSRKIFTRKEKTFPRISNLTIVPVSRWLTNCVKESSLFELAKVTRLPNPIDTNIFKSLNKEVCKDLWNLPKDKKLILFGAMSATSDKRKGYRELIDSLSTVTDNDVELVVFGSSKPKQPSISGFKPYYLGHLSDDVSLVTLYNAVDVIVVPSLEENLSLIIIESLSCGTPVVAFNIGGNSDMITHKKNGYLAKPLDSIDLARGIEWVLNHPKYNELCHFSRERAVKEFDSDYVGQKYIQLYKEIISS
jgi:glycosyltransferase involved in cell wall biosynthesis